jgi:hypothetical protein
MLALFVTASLFAGSRLSSVSSAQAEEKAAEEQAPTSFKNVEPVEPSMHELMEYVFEEPYKRLKATLPGETQDRAYFRELKSDSLILAEGGNMLLMRLPKEDAEAWTELSLAVRGEATALYKAGKAKDVEGARKLFGSLVLKCNACHDKFAGGEHQLEP